MFKQTFLVSPFGELSLRPLPQYVHILASDQMAGDWGLGWWHAQSAGDEMEFARTFWRAELSAGSKPSPGRTELDAFLGQWGFSADLEAESAALPAGQRSRIQAYVQGVNQGRRRRGKELPWTTEDCHLLARTLGFLEWWETRAPQIRFLLEAWRTGLTWEKVLDLWPGLGPEPDRRDWDGVELPPPFSAEALVLLQRLRRFRPTKACVVSGHRAVEGRPLLAAGYVSDVTEPGLPFVPVRLDTPVGSVRGLSRPGHPGFLAGRTGWLAWHASPVVDDTIDLRVVDQGTGRGIKGRWAGTGRTGTLGALLTLEEAAGVDLAKERTQGTGSAPLDVSAVDSSGGAQSWALGPRWRRLSPRDAWLPTWGTATLASVGRTTVDQPGPASAGRTTAASLVARFSSSPSPWIESVLAPVRFLLPDTEEGRRLRRWTGEVDCAEAVRFERVYEAILEAFWESSPLKPSPDSAVSQALATVVDSLIQAPHSAWLPSTVKNHLLAGAVRRAFAAGAPRGPSVLARRSPRPCWKEVQGGRTRTFAMTTAFVVDPGKHEWQVFHTDDETEAPVFQSW